MRVCHCIMAGTKACDGCYNNGNFNYSNNGMFNTTTTTKTTFKLSSEAEDLLTKEDYKELLKYFIDKCS